MNSEAPCTVLLVDMEGVFDRLGWLFPASEVYKNTYSLERTARCNVVLTTSSRRRTPHLGTLWSSWGHRYLRCTSVQAHICMCSFRSSLGSSKFCIFRSLFHALHWPWMERDTWPLVSDLLHLSAKRLKRLNPVCIWRKLLFPTSSQSQCHGTFSVHSSSSAGENRDSDSAGSDNSYVKVDKGIDSNSNSQLWRFMVTDSFRNE